MRRVLYYGRVNKSILAVQFCFRAFQIYDFIVKFKFAKQQVFSDESTIPQVYEKIAHLKML